MNIPRPFFVAALITFNASAFAETPKKMPRVVTVKDLALREAKVCDLNHNGRIDAAEFSQVRLAQSKKPNGYLYLFDLNENKYLDDSELSKIKLGPAKPPLTHQPPAQKK